MANPTTTKTIRTESYRVGMEKEGTYWWGLAAEVPLGWRIANGKFGTPDATTNFIRTASKDSDVGKKYGYATAQPINPFKVGEQTQNGQKVKINPPDVTTEGADISANITGLNSPPAGPTTSWQWMQSRLNDGDNLGLSEVENEHTHNRISKQLDTVFIKPKVKHSHVVKQKEFDSGVLPNHDHPLEGGDAETVPKHIMAYFIVWCGVEVTEEGELTTKHGWL